MPLIDIFGNRAFSAVEVTHVLNDVPFRPEMLGAMGEALFPTINSRFRVVAVVKRATGMALVPVSPIGAPPVELERPGADIRPFFTRRLAKASTIYAEELQGILQLPDFQQVASVQGEIVTRGVQIRADIELTHEHMRLGAVLGKVIDADGVRVLDDWFANWGVTEPTPFNFALTTATTNIRTMCGRVRDAMYRASVDAWITGRTKVHALVGDTFWELITTHPNVIATYLNWTAAAELRRAAGGDAEDEWDYGGILFHRYRGTPGGEFNIASNEARFFPVGARNAFSRALGPGEFEPFINTPGQEVIGITIPDRDRGAWMRYEAYSYPLYVCLRPEMLQRAVSS